MTLQCRQFVGATTKAPWLAECLLKGWRGLRTLRRRPVRSLCGHSGRDSSWGDPSLPFRLDPESAEWVRSLTGTPAEREVAAARLHEVLLRIARSEGRRRGDLRVTGAELDDLAHQAAADALMAITNKVGQFRGESRFTTWAYKFVIFEVSTKIGRHFWRHATVALGTEDWDRLADRFGLDPPGSPSGGSCSTPCTGLWTRI